MHHVASDEPAQFGHRIVEDRGNLLILFQIAEVVPSADPPPCGFPGFHAVKEIARAGHRCLPHKIVQYRSEFEASVRRIDPIEVNAKEPSSSSMQSSRLVSARSSRCNEGA